MDTRRSVRPLSRRHFLGTLGVLSGAALVAACSQPATPAPAPAKPAAAAPAAPAAPASPAPSAAAAAKPADASSLNVASGVFNVWFNANWNTVTDEKIGQSFVEWGKANGGQKVEWQSIPGSPQVLAKQSAAVAAGQPPEVSNQNLTYWYSQGEIADVKPVALKFKDQAGGIPHWH